MLRECHIICWGLFANTTLSPIGPVFLKGGNGSEGTNLFREAGASGQQDGCV
jgi:hypothetical protein